MDDDVYTLGIHVNVNVDVARFDSTKTQFDRFDITHDFFVRTLPIICPYHFKIKDNTGGSIERYALSRSRIFA